MTLEISLGKSDEFESNSIVERDVSDLCEASHDFGYLEGDELIYLTDFTRCYGRKLGYEIDLHIYGAYDT